MRDHRYVLDDPNLRQGRVMFRVNNQDEVEHDVALVHLPDDVSGVQEWLDTGEGPGGVYPVYLMSDRAPGETGVFALDLPAGHYGLLCLLTNANGTAHYENGMVASFRVASPKTPTSPPPSATPQGSR